MSPTIDCKSEKVRLILTYILVVFLILFLLFAAVVIGAQMLFGRPNPENQIYEITAIETMGNKNTKVSMPEGIVEVLGPFYAAVHDTVNQRVIINIGRRGEKKMLCHRRTGQCGLIINGRLS